jgi:hypothetical protein
VLSNDTANALLNRVQVVPISSRVGRLYPAEAYITLNGEHRKAMDDQVTTASKLPPITRLGTLSRPGGPWQCRTGRRRPVGPLMPGPLYRHKTDAGLRPNRDKNALS